MKINGNPLKIPRSLVKHFTQLATCLPQNARKRRASVLETSDEEDIDGSAHPELVNSEDTDSSIEQERAMKKAKRRKLGRAFKSRAREKTTLRAMRGCCQNPTRFSNFVFVDGTPRCSWKLTI